MDEQSPPTAFEGEIGMSMSGGGYRAAAFHLGALAYLDSLGLRDRLTHISTVSGGTFVGAAYTRSLVERKPFGEFFRSFYTFLGETNLVQRGLDQLGRHAPGVPSGREDLIISMARVYSKTFMQGADGRPLPFGAILDADIALREVVFNATEFRKGIAFRFQRSADPDAKIGNHYFDLPYDVARHIEVADIVAASSCFPGGFEPMAFPVDFAWPDGKVPKMPGGLAEKFEEPLALMDGGVYDNQGLSSLMLADERAEGELTMCIVSDVDQNPDDLYPFPSELELGWVGHLTLRWVNWLARLVSVACLATVGVVSYLWATRGGAGFWDIFGFTIPVVLAALAGGGIWAARRAIRVGLEDIPASGGTGWTQLQRLSVNQFLNMLNLRVTSVLALTSSVFMKRIRSLVRDDAYEKKGYWKKLVANYIYALRSPAEFDGGLAKRDVKPPPPELQSVIDVAAAMKTTLWFDGDKPWQLPCLVAAGQANLAYNLMRWVNDRQKTAPESYADLWGQLSSDWDALCEDPYALLKPWLEGPSPAAPPRAAVRPAAP